MVDEGDPIDTSGEEKSQSSEPSGVAETPQQEPESENKVEVKKVEQPAPAEQEKDVPKKTDEDKSKTSERETQELVRQMIKALEAVEKAQGAVSESVGTLGSIANAVSERGIRALLTEDDLKILAQQEKDISDLGKKLVGDATKPAGSPEHDGLLETLLKVQQDAVNTITAHDELMRIALRQIEESQLIPETLKNPTPERMLSRMTDKDREEFLKTRKEIKNSNGIVIGERWDTSYPAYATAVKEWLEERMEGMELNELSYEEQGNAYTYIMLHINNFLLTPETRNLGEEMRANFEKRRIAHMVTRAWNLSGPEQIMAVGSRMTFTTFSGFFKDEIVAPEILDKNGKRKKDKDGKEMENPVEKQLQNYERMGRILRERRDELRHVNRALEKFKRMKKYPKENLVLTDDEKAALQRMVEEDISLRDKLTDDEKAALRSNLSEDINQGINTGKLSNNVKESIHNSRKRLLTETKAKEQYIVDYYKLGGSVYDEGLNGAYVGPGEYNGNNDNKDGFFYKVGTDKQGYSDSDGVEHRLATEDLRASFYEPQLQNLDPTKKEAIKMRKDLWAKKYAGKLWSITFRAAYHDVQLNGTGDFFGARIMNLSDRLATNALMKSSRGIWDPLHRDNPYDIGYEDVITDFTKKVKSDELKKIGIMVDGKAEKDDKVREKRQIRKSGIKTLENFKWGSSELWDQVLMEPDSRPAEGGALAIRYTRFNDADRTRSKSWGADSFFHKPSPEGLVGREGVHAERGTSETTYEVMDRNGKPMLDRDGNPVVIEGISGTEWGWIDDLDRSCESYLRTPEAADWLGSPLTGYAEKATIREWINTATKNGQIDSDTRDILLRKHFGTNNKFLLNRMVEISVLWNDMKQNAGGMTWQAFVELLKRAFGYVFTDELRS